MTVQVGQDEKRASSMGASYVFEIKVFSFQLNTIEGTEHSQLVPFPNSRVSYFEPAGMDSAETHKRNK